MLSFRNSVKFTLPNVEFELQNMASYETSSRCYETVTVEKFRDNVRASLVALQSEKTELTKMSTHERGYKFLWAAFNGDIRAMEDLLSNGVSVDSVDPKKGLTALHLAALNGFTETIKWLLAHKCSFIKTKNGYTALHFAVLSRSKIACVLLVERGCPIDKLILHSAVQADSLDCIQYFLKLKAPINDYDATGLTPLHIAVNHDNIQTIELLLSDKRVHLTAKTKYEKYTVLHIAAENGSVDTLRNLLKKGVNVNELSAKKQSPLYVACRKQHLACVEVLLTFGAAVNQVDKNNQTPLFASICDSPHSLFIMKKLIEYQAFINQMDCEGCTPVHIAALNCLDDCVDFLIMNGANVTAKTHKNVSALSIISRNTPSSLVKIQERLDMSLELCKNRYLRFSFEDIINNSRVGETCYLYDLQNERQSQVLEHPICRAFLHFKWQRIRIFILVRVIIVLFTVCLMSAYMLWAIGRGCYDRAFGKLSITFDMNYGCTNQSFISVFLLEHPSVMKVSWIVILNMFVLNAIRILFTMAGVKSALHYFRKPFNILELSLTILTVLLCIRDENGSDYRWQTTVAAVVVLMSWIYLMFVLSYLSTFGVYVIMFNEVLKEFLKVMITFVCLLIGFTFTFCILESETFIDPIAGFVKTIGMMTGELYVYDIIDKDDLIEDKTQKVYWWERYVTISVVALFMIFITIALMNMFISLVVSDVHTLQTRARPSKHIQQTKLIHMIEKCCLEGFFPLFMVKWLKRALYVWPDERIKEVTVETHNPKDIRLIPSDVIEDAERVAASQLKRIQEAKRQAMQTSRTPVEDEVHELKKLVKNMSSSVQHMLNIIESRMPDMTFVTKEVDCRTKFS